MDIKAPHPLDLNGNVYDEWIRFKQRFFLYLEATEKSKKTGKTKVALLLCLLGNDCLDIFNNFNLSDSDKDNFDLVVESFDNYFEPKTNTVVDRYKFFNMKQNPDETIDSFITKIKTQARKCKFGEQEESLVRDLLIIGTKDEGSKERLLMEPDLKLDKAIKLCKTREQSKKQVELMKGQILTNKSAQDQTEIHKIVKDSLDRRTNNQTFKTVCSKCMTKHGYRNCPAWGKRCLNCKKLNHFAKACKESKLNSVEMEEPENADNLREDYSVSIKTVVSIDSVSSWTQTLSVNGIDITFKLDTGADVNVIPYKMYQQIAPDYNINPSGKCLKSYSGHDIKVLGTCLLNCTISGTKVNSLEEFYVVNDEACPILGLHTCSNLNLIKRVNEIAINNNIFSEYKDVFDNGLGKLPLTYDIKLVDKVVPKVHSARIIPRSLNEMARVEINKMVDDGVLKAVCEPTDWVHPIVITKKSNGKLRICMDPRALNKYIKREHYKMPTLQEIFSQLEGAKFFSVLDASSAFLQIPLSEESSRLCTIATPFGRFRYCRLPYGLNSSPEVFQKAMDNVILGLNGVISYIDDILVFGSSKEEHDKRLNDFLNRARGFGLKLSKDKSQICTERVIYLGHELTSNGISIVESKLKAIQEYPCPKDKNDLQRFLGMITYVGRFINNLSDKTGVLRSLLSKEKSFIWSSIEQKCFDNLKEEIVKSPVLSFFDNTKTSILSVDASKFGLGAVLIQDNHPIGYSSSALTSTQQRYSQIEKELLAVVNGCKKFHYYLYGTKFVIETDHKPLIGLLEKPISNLSPRLQRMVMELLRYEFTIVHVPGKKMYIADSLSRAPLDNNVNTDYLENGAEVVYSLVIFASDDILDNLKSGTETDAQLQKVRYYIENGWPEHKADTDIEAHTFWDKRDEFHEFENLIYLGSRLVIPKDLRPNILNQLHASHQGVNACQNKARMAFYWPGMMRDIKEKVSHCSICQAYQRSNPKEPLEPYPVPENPWEEVGVDFFKIKGTEYMLVIDYHSKFVEIKKMETTNAEAVTNKLTQIFRTHGLPKKMHTDNGPPFDSHKFASFINQYQITHETSSPYYPKSNGMVERAIQTLKSMLIKTMNSKGDLNLVVIDYNNTPKDHLKAPAQMLMGRLLKTVLPVPKVVLKPIFPTGDTVQVLKRKQVVQKTYYDRSSHHLRPLEDNEEVYVQNGKRDWVPGKIIRAHEMPNSYIVKTEDGTYRRNRIHLRPAKVNRNPPALNNSQEFFQDRLESHQSLINRPKRVLKLPAQLKDFVL